jgi:hypothetical protein
MARNFIVHILQVHDHRPLTGDTLTDARQIKSLPFHDKSSTKPFSSGLSTATDLAFPALTDAVKQWVSTTRTIDKNRFLVENVNLSREECCCHHKPLWPLK